ncbi:MAG: hypothetical protein J5781_01305, partial [Clostridia bacterium]|nr:hypothetical protein [Clostridia bacterium]
MKSLRVGVNGLFCGHDHISNSILYENYDADTESPVFLCYGVSSGLQGYKLYQYGMSETEDYTMRGYSVIYVNADCSFDFYGVLYDTEYALIPRVIASKPVSQ